MTKQFFVFNTSAGTFHGPVEEKRVRKYLRDKDLRGGTVLLFDRKGRFRGFQSARRIFAEQSK